MCLFRAILWSSASSNLATGREGSLALPNDVIMVTVLCVLCDLSDVL